MSKNLKIFLGVSYLLILFFFLYFIFTAIEINRLNDFAYYKEIQSNLETYISKNILINVIYFFILQQNIGSNDIKKILKNKNFIYFPDMDKSEKACIDSTEIIKNLDLVITSDTAIGHLSATLGKKTWIAIPHIADWRWFSDKVNTKWYSSVTIFRQKKIGDWSGLFENIRDKLKNDFFK